MCRLHVHVAGSAQSMRLRSATMDGSWKSMVVKMPRFYLGQVSGAKMHSVRMQAASKRRERARRCRSQHYQSVRDGDTQQDEARPRRLS